MARLQVSAQEPLSNGGINFSALRAQLCPAFAFAPERLLAAPMHRRGCVASMHDEYARSLFSGLRNAMLRC